jgi:hypothetical protein
VPGFGYTTPLKVAAESSGVLRFSEDADLGWWAGGVYHHEGYVMGTNFLSTYRCKYDHGTFSNDKACPRRTVPGAAGPRQYGHCFLEPPQLVEKTKAETHSDAAGRLRN